MTIYIDRISKVGIYINSLLQALDNFRNMKLWFKRWMEQGYEGIELILYITWQTPIPNNARNTALMALTGFMYCIDEQSQNDYMNFKQRNLGNPEEWEDYDWIRETIIKDIPDNDPTKKLECFWMAWYYHYWTELGLESTDWPMETNKDRTPYFNYTFLPNTSIHIRPSLIICQISPLSGPAIGTSFKSPILYIAHLRRTSRNTSNSKISLDSLYLSNWFNQMSIDNLVPLPASSMNSIRTKLMKGMPKFVLNISKKQTKDKYNKTPYETLPTIFPNWPG